LNINRFFIKKILVPEKKQRHPLNVKWSSSKPTSLSTIFFHQESVNTWTNDQSIFSLRFLLMTVYVFENIVIMIATWTDFFSSIVAVINFCGIFFQFVYFNFCVNLAAPWYNLVKWTYILETMMHRFPSIWQTVSSNFF